MKKQITSLALMLSIGMVASAATPLMSRAKEMTDLTIRNEANLSVLSSAPQLTKKGVAPAPKKATTKDDLMGEYIWEFYDLYNQSMRTASAEIVQSEAYADSLELTLNGTWTVNLGYDLAKSVVKFPRLAFQFFNTTDGVDVYWIQCDREPFIDEEDGQEHWRLKVVDEPYVEASFSEGVIRVGETDPELATVQNEITWLFSNPEFIFPNGSVQFYGGMIPVLNTLTHLYANEYVASEWEDFGRGDLREGWLYPVFTGEVGMSDPYEVGIRRNKVNHKLIAIMNPYGSNTPFYQVCETEGTGVIVLNVENDQVVKVMPRWYATSMNMGTEEQPVMNGIYPSNIEAYYSYTYNAPDDEILSTLLREGGDCSWLDTDTGEILLYNLVFGVTGQIGAPLSWTFTEGNMFGAIDIPYLHVEGITAEDANAPKIYYNLQGQKVANPEKGQLVIVRQGNASYKTIAH